MPGTNTSDQNTIPRPAKIFAGFTAREKTNALPISLNSRAMPPPAAVSSLQIIDGSNLAREVNQDCDPGHASGPAIGASDATNLLRLSLAASSMLCQLAQDKIASLNK